MLRNAILTSNQKRQQDEILRIINLLDFYRVYQIGKIINFISQKSYFLIKSSAVSFNLIV